MLKLNTKSAYLPTYHMWCKTYPKRLKLTKSLIPFNVHGQMGYNVEVENRSPFNLHT